MGLFGRTAILKGRERKAPKELKLDEWIVFHSDLDLSQTYLICEIIINVYDKNKAEYNNGFLNNIGLGTLAI